MCQPYKKIIKSPLELRFPSSNKKRTQKETQSSCLVEKSQVHFLKTWSPNVAMQNCAQCYKTFLFGNMEVRISTENFKSPKSGQKLFRCQGKVF